MGAYKERCKRKKDFIEILRCRVFDAHIHDHPSLTNAEILRSLFPKGEVVLSKTAKGQLIATTQGSATRAIEDLES